MITDLGIRFDITKYPPPVYPPWVLALPLEFLSRLEDLPTFPNLCRLGVEGWNTLAQSSANSLKNGGFTREEVREVLTKSGQNYRDPVEERDIEKVVCNAWDNSSPVDKTHWPEFDQTTRENLLTVTETAFLEGHGTPEAIEPWEILESLFPGDPLLCLATDAKERCQTRFLSEWKASAVQHNYLVPSPMTQRTGFTKDGKESGRSLENTGKRKYLVTECDKATRCEQWNVISHLSSIAPLVMVLDTGNKSLHAWFRCDGTENDEQAFMAYAVRLGADKATWTRSQLVRLPGGTHQKTSNLHKVLVFRPQKSAAEMWKPELIPGTIACRLTTVDASGEVGKKPSLKDMLITSADLIERTITARPQILGKWMREGDLGYLFAPRGHGKTWLAMMIGKSIAEGQSLGEWHEGEVARRVIYFDAEMNLPDVQERAKLIGITSFNFIWLQNEIVFEKLKRGLNIADVSDQVSLAEMLEDGDVLIIDNLSTAASGMAENDNDAFDQIKSWLLGLRGRKITVVIVHHAGRNGLMRGASRREDMAHWIISLIDDSGDGEKKAWLTHFKKCRNCKATEAPSLRWVIQTSESLTYECKEHSGPEAMLGLIRDGIETATDLAEELSVTKGCISKWAKKLAAEGKIKINERKYTAL